MARLTRLVLMLSSVCSFATVAPATSEAGVIPWAYDAIFGPVGSLRSGAAYAPYSGYGGTYAGYAPMSVAYAPTTAFYGSTSSYGSGASYSGGSGCSCNQSSNYAPWGGYDSYGYASQGYYGSGCSNCSSGNCSNGSCSNCNVNSSPATSGYGSTTSGYGSTGVAAPIPDPTNMSRDMKDRLNQIEHKQNEIIHRLNEDERFFRRQHEDYRPAPVSTSRNTPSTYGDTVPARKKLDTFGSNPSDERFSRPRTGAPTGEPLEEETKKPVIDAPDAGTKNSTEKTNNTDATTVREVEPQTLRLDSRITSQAVAPRQRMQIVTNQSKVALAKATRKFVKTSSESHQSTDLVRK